MSRYDPIEINKGEGLDEHLVFTDASGSVIDLSSIVSIEVYETYPETMLELMTVEATQQDYDGTLKWGASVQLSAADAWPDDGSVLRIGNVQWFRIAVTYEEGRPDVSPQQWVKVI